MLLETITNPMLRVPPMDKIAEIARRADVPVIVDNTFATPMLMRPLELGAGIVIHSATKYLAGHGDALGGVVVCEQAHFETLKTLVRTMGPNLGPFEAYLTMRGIKTLAMRMERQCQNACKVAAWLKSHPRVARVHFPGDPAHPDAATVERLLPKNMTGAMVAVELKDAGQKRSLRVHGKASDDRARDVARRRAHAWCSIRRWPRIGISRRNIGSGWASATILIRVSVGIEAIDDIIADLDQRADERKRDHWYSASQVRPFIEPRRQLTCIVSPTRTPAIRCVFCLDRSRESEPCPCECASDCVKVGWLIDRSADPQILLI